MSNFTDRHGACRGIAFAITALAGIFVGSFAVAQPVNPDGKWSDSKLADFAVALTARCQSTIGISDLASLRPQSWKLDNDTRDDFYVDVPPTLLASKGCDVPTTRFVWRSTENYSGKLMAEDAGEAAFNSSQELSPHEAPTPDAGPVTIADPVTPEVPTVAPATQVEISQPPNDRPAEGPPTNTSRAETNIALVVIIVGILAFIAVVTAFVKTAIYSVNRYEYRLILNWNTLLWLVGGVLLSLGIFWIFPAPGFYLPVKLGTVAFCALPWTFAVFRNIQRTSVPFGLWASLVQALCAVPAGLVATWMLLQAAGWQSRHRASY